MHEEGILYRKSYPFAVRIVKMVRYLQEEKREFVLSKQILKSGTAVCALISEAKFASSKADFANKLHISLKEANETRYWLDLLKDTEYLEESSWASMRKDNDEILRLLVSSINKIKQRE